MLNTDINGLEAAAAIWELAHQDNSNDILQLICEFVDSYKSG